MEQVFVTPHAMLRASEEFGVNYGPEARDYIKENLKKATYVSEIVGESGKVDRLFGYRRIAFVLDRYDNVVITVYPRTVVDAELRSKVTELLFEHLEELKHREKAAEDDLLRLDMEIEMLWQLSRAGVGEFAIGAQVANIERRQKEKELRNFQLERSRVAKGVVAYL
jgi:hypothetical protein